MLTGRNPQTGELEIIIGKGFDVRLQTAFELSKYFIDRLGQTHPSTPEGDYQI